MNIIT